MDENSNSFSFVDMEHEILRFWEEGDIFSKSLKRNPKSNAYIFYDGPPFATGLPHHGHLLAGTIKDIIPRYWTMKGFYVERRFGWDCHGLPVEHEIDKKLGMNTFDAVKKLGIAGYNDECRSIVGRYVRQWEKTVHRIGRWVDFKGGYRTMDKDFMESVWWVFKSLWEKGLIYRGTRVVPFSTSLGTVLSNFEAGLNYQDVQDPALTVLFKLKEEETFIAVWTTTPWTLPSNLALCVGEDIDYIKVWDKDIEKVIILAKSRLDKYGKNKNLEHICDLKGKHLVGKMYKPIFSFFQDKEAQGAFQILSDGFVATDTGTGIVHLAPAFGEDDNRIMKEAGVEAFVCPVDDTGAFTREVPPYEGIHVKEADKNIIQDLKNKSQVYDHSAIVHSYPFCYRSDTPLIYKAIPSWYVKVEQIKKDIMMSNAQTYWVPAHIKDGRFGKWLEGARDWAISRNRVWGTPIPVWYNEENKKFICIGSVKELEKYAGTKVADLHRDIVDDLEFSLPGETGAYRRISEVLDCWFESGSMPYAQAHYPFENKERFEQNFPAQFIAEGLDQTRGWFYTLTVLSTALFNRPAFKNVIVNGMIMAQDGKKMSKRLKNYTPPDVLMETYGADGLRLYLISSPLVRGEEQRFSDDGVKEMVRKVLIPWYNASKFFSTYAEIDGWTAQAHFKVGTNSMDNWILSRLQTLKSGIEKEMEAYRLYNVAFSLMDFIEDLTNWYIRLNRSRFWGGRLSQDKCEAFTSLYTAVSELSMLMAPFSPFLADHIYRELLPFDSRRQEESIHLCDYPVCAPSKLRPKLEDSVERSRQVILLGRKRRNAAQIKVKIPLQKLVIIHKDNTVLDGLKEFEAYIKTELNVKEIIYDQGEDKFIRLYAKPNLPVLGKRLGKKMGRFVKAIQKLAPKEIVRLEKEGSIVIEGEEFSRGDIFIFREAKEGSGALSNRFISIVLDTVLTDDLLQEGLAREVVNRIQKTRKKMGLDVENRIHICYEAEGRLLESLKKYGGYIKGETLAKTFSKVESCQDAHKFTIEGEALKLSLERA